MRAFTAGARHARLPRVGLSRVGRPRVGRPRTWLPLVSGIAAFAAACDDTTEADPVLHAVNVTVSGSGIVRSVPQGIDCPSDCGEMYTARQIRLNAIPLTPGDTTWVWTGACEGFDDTGCLFDLTGDTIAGVDFDDDDE